MKVEDLFPGDMIKARAPGFSFATSRLISDIKPGPTSQTLQVEFSDGSVLVAIQNQELEDYDFHYISYDGRI